MVMYWGLPGTYKTLCLTDDCVNDMTSSILRVYVAYDKVDEYNSQGFNFSKNFEHLSGANVDINSFGTPIPNLRSYKVNPYKIGMPSKDYKTAIYPNGFHFYITEFQNYCDSNMYQYLRPETKQYYQTKRQAGIDFTVDCQRPTDIAKPIRDLFDTFVECIQGEDIFLDGVVVGHKVKQRIIRNPRTLEEYLKTNNKDLCEEYIRIINNCRFDNYDSYFCEMLHLKGRENQDYKLIHFKEEDDSDILTIPNGYYKQKKANLKVENNEGVIYYD